MCSWIISIIIMCECVLQNYGDSNGDGKTFFSS